MRDDGSSDLVSELVLGVGAELGSIELLGTRAARGWLFHTSIKDQSIWLLNEEDRGDLVSQHASEWVDSWEAALALLDKYPWHRLHPLAVHPEFKQKIWAAVQERFQKERRSVGGQGSFRHYLEPWRKLCGVR
jgi:hypothetical protein